MREDQPQLSAARAARETESSPAAGDDSVFVSSVSCHTSNADGLIDIRDQAYLKKSHLSHTYCMIIIYHST